MKIKNRETGEWRDSPATNTEKEKKDKAIVDFNKAGNTQQKIDAIALFLGLKQ